MVFELTKQNDFIDDSSPIFWKTTRCLIWAVNLHSDKTAGAEQTFTDPPGNDRSFSWQAQKFINAEHIGLPA